MNSSPIRKQYIQDMLEAEGAVQVSGLASALNVSELTIRRDLSELEHIGLLKRTHGGAVKEVSRSYEPPFDIRQKKSLIEKQLIAKEACCFVSEGDTIVIDSGTTAIELAKQLLSFHNLTVVTPSLHIAMLFLSHPTIRVIVSGSEVRKREGSLIGNFTKQMFKSLYFDTFFMATAGISHEAGLTEYIIEDASIKNEIVSHSKKTIALMSSEKFGQTAFAKVGSFNDIDDKEPNNRLYMALNSNGVETRIASAKGEIE